MAALQELPEEVSNDPLDLNPRMNDIRADFFNSEASTQAGYGLTELGAAAVPALIEAASTSDAPLIRSRAIDVLGDIGPAAAAALPMLVDALTKEEHVDPRRRAVEAIGTVGCGAPDQVLLVSPISFTSHSRLDRLPVWCCMLTIAFAHHAIATGAAVRGAGRHVV